MMKVFVYGAVLVLFALSASAGVLSFQAGDGGAYSDSEDTFLQQNSPDTNHATNQYLQFDLGGATVQKALVRFPDIFGAATGQIPPGSTINSCSLILMFTAGSTSLHRTHRVTAAWDIGTVTWNSFGSAPGGVAGTDYLAAAAGGFVPNLIGVQTVDITSACQAWSDGDANNGVIIVNSSSDESQCHSDDAALVADHPLLVVDFTPEAVAAEDMTWGGVKTLYR